METERGGTGEPAANPWPTYVSFVTTGSTLPALTLGLRSLLEKNPRKLPGYGILWAALATISRKDICARCPYYGEYCSTLFGKITPLVFPHSDKPMTTRGFYWDLALLPALFLYPIPEINRSSRKRLVAYIVSWAVFLAAMYSLACRRCPLEACPVPRPR
ncbi:MAG: hypothetical protein AB1384_09685 [Actinomycetota bacterium]